MTGEEKPVVVKVVINGVELPSEIFVGEDNFEGGRLSENQVFDLLEDLESDDEQNFIISTASSSGYFCIE